MVENIVRANMIQRLHEDKAIIKHLEHQAKIVLVTFPDGHQLYLKDIFKKLISYKIHKYTPEHFKYAREIWRLVTGVLPGTWEF